MKIINTLKHFTKRKTSSDIVNEAWLQALCQTIELWVFLDTDITMDKHSIQCFWQLKLSSLRSIYISIMLKKRLLRVYPFLFTYHGSRDTWWNIPWHTAYVILFVCSLCARSPSTNGDCIVRHGLFFGRQ